MNLIAMIVVGVQLLYWLPQMLLQHYLRLDGLDYFRAIRNLNAGYTPYWQFANEPDISPGGYLYPPAFAVLLSPLGHLSWTGFSIVWTLLMESAYLGFAIVLSRISGRGKVGFQSAVNWAAVCW